MTELAIEKTVGKINFNIFGEKSVKATIDDLAWLMSLYSLLFKHCPADQILRSACLHYMSGKYRESASVLTVLKIS